jgi:hypothetical protein
VPALDDGGDVLEVADTHFLLVGDEGAMKPPAARPSAPWPTPPSPSAAPWC